MPADRRPTCFVPRGDSRLHAIALKHAVLRQGHDPHTVTAAVMLATQAHRHQKRSADGAPYLVHPLQVARLVCHWGGAQDDVVAAVLHDAAEDDPGGPQPMLARIHSLFGRAVSLRVQALTKNTGLACRAQRAQDLQARLLLAMASLGPGLAAIRLADRLHNTATSAHFEAPRLQRLLDENQRYIAPLASRLGTPAIAGFLQAGPAVWSQVEPGGFVPAMLALQPPWLQGSRHTPQAQPLPA